MRRVARSRAQCSWRAVNADKGVGEEKKEINMFFLFLLDLQLGGVIGKT